MSEMYGLRVLVSDAVERGTLHILESPPERESFASDDDYERAYREWWDHMNCWTVTNVT